MRRRISIAELQHAGVAFRAVEAVAIAQQLIRPFRRVPSPDVSAPPGPPSPANVFLDSDGAASCAGADATPAISEIAIFLQQLLPPGTLGVPGSLRYTLARALLEVDAPPFDSLDQFVAALTRHQPCDAKAIVRGLLDRVAQTDAGVAATIERRRAAPNIADLRRQLRAADARVYEQQIALDALSAMTAAPPRSRTPSRLAITVAAGLMLMSFGAWEAVHTRPPALVAATKPAADVPTVASPSPAPMPAALTTDTVAPATSDDDPRLEPASSSSTDSSAKRASRADAGRRIRARQSPKLLDRLHLTWLRSKVAIRAEAP